MSAPGPSDCGDAPAYQPLLTSTSSSGGSSPSKNSSQVTPEELYTKQHFGTPKINIGHVYVYNFSPAQPVDSVIEFPSPTDAAVKTKQSPAASSGPICRICHEGDIHEDLLSPCYCTGTVGLVHLSCVEKWLGTSGSDKCEICQYAFATVRYPKSFSEWVRSASSNSGRRTFWGDLTCFFLLTPLAAVSSYLSIDGALKQVQFQNSIEAGCLVALATFLISVYFVWSVLTIRYHLKIYFTWRQKNHNVKILVVRRLSSTDGRFLSTKRPNAVQGVPTPRTHRQSHRSENVSSVASNRRNISDTEASGSAEEYGIENRMTSHPQYNFNGTDFIEHLTAMLETAL